MVTLQTIRHSNAQLSSSLPQGLTALFIGATSGIGQSILHHLLQHAPDPRIYSVARPASVSSHQSYLSALQTSHPSATLTLLQADPSLVSEIDKVADTLVEKETHLDMLVLSAGFMAFEGRINTREGLDPSMSTRYYARVRAIQKVLPLLKASSLPSPRILYVLAGGWEQPLVEDDLDLRDPANWTYWSASVQAATMSTLALERVARENPGISIAHWYPGLVETPGLERSRAEGRDVKGARSAEEAGERGLFVATSDRYAVKGGLVPVPEGVVVERSGGGIFLVDAEGERVDNEVVLGGMRRKGMHDRVWEFTQKIFDECTR